MTGNRKNPFDDSFLNTFLPTVATGPSKIHAPADAIAQQLSPGREGKTKEISALSTVITEFGEGAHTSVEAEIHPTSRQP